MGDAVEKGWLYMALVDKSFMDVVVEFFVGKMAAARVANLIEHSPLCPSACPATACTVCTMYVHVGVCMCGTPSYSSYLQDTAQAALGVDAGCRLW